MAANPTSHTRLRSLTEGAILIALAEILSFLPLYKMPWGGSIDLAMLPIIVYGVRWGFGPGLIVSFAHGILQTLFEGGIAIGWESILGDFLIAYAVLGTAGLFKGKFWQATVVACSARFLVHYVVGATIWAAYMLPDAVIILVIGAVLLKTPAKKYLLGEDLK